MSLATLRSTPGTYLGSDGLVHTAPAGVVRWDYSTGQPLALNEPAKTNYCPNSSLQDGGTWGGTVTVTQNAATAPTGTSVAAKIIATGTGGATSDKYTSPAVGTYAISVWMRADSATAVSLYAIRNDSSGTQHAALKAVTLTAAWQRITLPVVTTQAGDTALYWQVNLTAGQIVYAWGTQYEPGSVVTSLILTSGGAATRAADALYTIPDPPSRPSPLYSDDDFLAGFQGLLPTGPIWPRDPDAVQTQTLRALMPTYTRQTARSVNLLADAFPVAPVELLPEWEATLGLPDPCAGISPTLQVRQQQVAARFVASGGQSVDYFVSVAAALGYAITITQFAPFRFGQTFGNPLLGAPWAFAWQVNAPTFSIERFTFGRDFFGEPLASWDNNVLQCEMQRLAPAHTTIMFSYDGSAVDFTSDFSGGFI